MGRPDPDGSLNPGGNGRSISHLAQSFRLRERTLRCPECGGQNRYALAEGAHENLGSDPDDLREARRPDLEVRLFLQELSEFPVFAASGPGGSWPDTFA